MTTMKRYSMAFMALAFAAIAAGAQSLADNSYYQQSLRLQDEANAAYEEGDYDKARELALQAQENARLSDEYVARMVSRQSAENAIAEAKDRFEWAAGLGAEKRYADDFSTAKAELEAANAAFAREEYDEAIAHAFNVMASLSGVTPAQGFPASYEVKELSFQTDCFWRIAAKPWVYNDPLQWPALYRANKDSMPDPANPDLIMPGMIIVIPSLRGELREGEYVEGVDYPTFGE